MKFSRSSAHSPYMEWAKLCSTAKYNLATSGVAPYPLAQLRISADELEINGPDSYGHGPLVAAIAARYQVSPDCVFTTAGTSLANHFALAATTEPGDEILVEQPTYELLLSTAQYLGLKVHRFPRPAGCAFQPDLDELSRSLSRRTKLVVLTNLHNPSGVPLSHDTLREIGELTARVQARVLVDEVYLEALLEKRPGSAFRLYPDRFLVTNSLTKAYGLSGLRCGWVLAAPELVHRMWRINDLYAATPVFPGEELSVIAFHKLEQISARAKQLLDVNRTALRQFLQQRRDLETIFPEHGTVCFPKLKSGNVEALCSLLREKFETTVVPGKFFEAPEHFRIGIGGEIEPVSEALQQLGRGLDAFGKQQAK